MKIEAPGALFEVLGDPLGAKMAQDAIWSASGAPFGWLLGRILAPRWAKLANLAPRCAQDGRLGGQDGQLGALLGESWRPVLRSCNENNKTTTAEHFWRFFGVLGLLLEAMLVHLGAMLGYVGPSGQHLGATWWQDVAQERQDETRWRKWAPERGSNACSET
jgi:hypothetical protein